MLAIRKLNNNAVICRDSRGREVVALGKGVGFGGDFPRELAMDHIERTFYSIDAEGQRIMQDLPADVVLFTAKIMDIVENELPYELSPNAVLIMADHIAFAIARQRKGIRFDMPLTYDVQQLYPLEYKIGRYITARVRQELGVELPREEVASIAMNLVNAKTGAEVTVASDRAQSFERLLNDVTDIVEYDSVPSSIGSLLSSHGLRHTCSICSSVSRVTIASAAPICRFMRIRARSFPSLRNASTTSVPI